MLILVLFEMFSGIYICSHLVLWFSLLEDFFIIYSVSSILLDFSRSLLLVSVLVDCLSLGIYPLSKHTIFFGEKFSQQFLIKILISVLSWQPQRKNYGKQAKKKKKRERENQTKLPLKISKNKRRH